MIYASKKAFLAEETTFLYWNKCGYASAEEFLADWPSWEEAAEEVDWYIREGCGVPG